MKQLNIINRLSNIFKKSFDLIDSGQPIRLDSNNKPVFWTLNSVYGIEKPTTQDLLVNAYGRNPYVANIINNIASGATTLERNYKRNGEIVEEREIDELLKNPNGRDDYKAFYQRIFTNLLVKEVFICGIAPIGMGKYSELIVPNIQNVNVNVGSVGQLVSYTVNYFGATFTFAPEDVLHIYTPDITYDNNRGYSRLDSNVDVWQTNNEVWQSEKYLHRNKGISGVLYSDGNRVMTPKEQKSLQEQYDTDHTGIAFGKVKVSNQKLGYLQMGMNPTDLQSIQSRLDHLRTLCAAYDLDSVLMGDVAGTTFNNLKEAEKRRMKNAVLPIAKWVDEAISKWLLQDNYGLNDTFIEVDKDKIEVIQEVETEVSSKVISEAQAGILSRRQAFEMLYPELDYEETIINNE